MRAGWLKPHSWTSRHDGLRSSSWGGLIFSGFAQASLTDHIIQPKRSRFFLALTAELPMAGGVTHADEDAVFAAAEQALQGTVAKTRRLDALPPVLPYLLAKAPSDVTAGDLLKRALTSRTRRRARNSAKRWRLFAATAWAHPRQRIWRRPWGRSARIASALFDPG